MRLAWAYALIIGVIADDNEPSTTSTTTLTPTHAVLEMDLERFEELSESDEFRETEDEESKEDKDEPEAEPSHLEEVSGTDENNIPLRGKPPGRVGPPPPPRTPPPSSARPNKKARRTSRIDSAGNNNYSE